MATAPTGAKSSANNSGTSPQCQGLHQQPRRPLSDADKQTNRRKSAVRSKVEHPFLTLKRIWGFAKVRYRGLAKNANRAYAMLALINVSTWGRPLTGEVSPA